MKKLLDLFSKVNEKTVITAYGVIIFLLGTFLVPCTSIGLDADSPSNIAFVPVWFIYNTFTKFNGLYSYTYHFNIQLALYLILILTILLFSALYLLKLKKKDDKSS